MIAKEDKQSNTLSNEHSITQALEFVKCIQKHLVGGYEVTYKGEAQSAL